MFVQRRSYMFVNVKVVDMRVLAITIDQTRTIASSFARPEVVGKCVVRQRIVTQRASCYEVAQTGALSSSRDLPGRICDYNILCEVCIFTFLTCAEVWSLCRNYSFKCVVTFRNFDQITKNGCKHGHGGGRISIKKRWSWLGNFIFQLSIVVRNVSFSRVAKFCF